MWVGDSRDAQACKVQRGRKNVMRLILQIIVTALFIASSNSAPAFAAGSEQPDAATAWRLLDYIAVDYSAAVSEGVVTSRGEYIEMVEFSQSASERIAGLPLTATKPDLIRLADRLKRAIADKAPADKVAELARALGREVLLAYPVSLAPSAMPNLSRTASLYAQQCASCHGPTGGGDGSGAAGLDPPPAAFTDMSRARQRSVFSLYQVINQGIDGTAMASFAQLDSADQWALAFHVGAFAFSEADARKGAKIWDADADLRQRFSNLEALTQITRAQLTQDIGEEKAHALIAFLRQTPEKATASRAAGLDIARARLRASVSAYDSGDRDRAADLALSAYLDGFEPLEPMLAVRDAGLLTQIESSMGALRAAIGRGATTAEVRLQASELVELFDQADNVLEQEAGDWVSSFVGSFTILLREGLEALLIVVAMTAFLRKAGRPEGIRYVHAGWVAALAGGAATWFAATRLIAVSGASRELTEGLGSLLAAAVLVSVGIWMHGKSQAGEWQRYIQKTMSKALSLGSSWFLFGLAFLVVYREVFETILFYAALWTERNGVAVLAGAGTAIGFLVAIAWAMLRYSRKLPIGKLLSYSAILIAILAVVLIGKGVAGLQEAGMVGITPWPFVPRIEMLGVFPASQPLIAQFLLIVIIAFGFWRNIQESDPLPHKPQEKNS